MNIPALTILFSIGLAASLVAISIYAGAKSIKSKKMAMTLFIVGVLHMLPGLIFLWTLAITG